MIFTIACAHYCQDHYEDQDEQNERTPSEGDYQDHYEDQDEQTKEQDCKMR